MHYTMIAMMTWWWVICYSVFLVTFEWAHFYSPPSRCISTAVKLCIWFIPTFIHQFFTRDFQHITKNCQTQSSLRRVENHTEEIKKFIWWNRNIRLMWINILHTVNNNVYIRNWLGKPCNSCCSYCSKITCQIATL